MTSRPIATTFAGRVEGLYVPAAQAPERTVSAFRGIPFATAARFGPPVPAPGWTGTGDASEFSPAAPQVPGMMDQMFGGRALHTSESDCLALNIWTPSCDTEGRPVMFWIHGGGFTGGSGSVPWYDGANFAALHDVVVVTINYRLGVFGFNYLPEIGNGNGGILDQIEALRWVQANIGAFGGDPANVTIFGESAGAMSVGTLLAVPAATGLFRRAIAQSGAANHTRTADQAAEVTDRLLRHLGLTASTAPKLLELPVEQLLAAQEAAAANAVMGGLPFSPVIDGSTIPTAPRLAIAAGSAAGIDLLTGVNGTEMTLFMALDHDEFSRDQLVSRAQRVLGDRSEEVIDTYIANRPGRALREVWVALASDMVFGAPARQLLEAQSPHARTHAYLFRWETPAFGGRLQSCHALEIPFVFNNLHAPGVAQFTGGGPERQTIAEQMHAAWAAFARTGDPGPDWPQWRPSARTHRIFDTSPGIEDDPRGDELSLWATT